MSLKYEPASELLHISGETNSLKENVEPLSTEVRVDSVQVKYHATMMDLLRKPTKGLMMLLMKVHIAGERERARESERERERARESERERERARESVRERERERASKRARERASERKRAIERARERENEKERDGERGRTREWQSQRQTARGMKGHFAWNRALSPLRLTVTTESHTKCFYHYSKVNYLTNPSTYSLY